MKSVILLVGDSWPHGEIDSEDNIYHGGIAKYFSDYGYTVYNLSYPGGSNLQSCLRLQNFCNCIPGVVNNISKVFFFQTEFFREMFHYDVFDGKRLIKDVKKGYAQLKSNWSLLPYYELSKIGVKYNIPIHIIGGCSDALFFEDNELNLVDVACYSWVNLLINGNHIIKEPVLTEFINGWVDPFLDLIKPNIKNTDLELLNHDIELGLQRIKLMHENTQLFGPDPIHPNRKAHKILFNFLVEKLKIQPMENIK